MVIDKFLWKKVKIKVVIITLQLSLTFLYPMTWKSFCLCEKLSIKILTWKVKWKLNSHHGGGVTDLFGVKEVTDMSDSMTLLYKMFCWFLLIFHKLFNPFQTCIILFSKILRIIMTLTLGSAGPIFNHLHWKLLNLGEWENFWNI